MRIMLDAMPFRPGWLAALALGVLLAGCSGSATREIEPSAASATPAEITPSPTATVTPEPLAASVHGEGISLARFEREVARFEKAQTELGIELATLGDYRSQVLETMIDRLLLALGAEGRGVVYTQEDIDGRMASIAEALGGEEAFSAWLGSSGYDREEFRADLAEEMLAASMVSSIVADLPTEVEQVHARHLLVATAGEAEALLERILAGEAFADLASVLSLDSQTRIAGGDLGWFMRGQLTVPEVEQAAFELQPGEVSGVIQSELGYHLVLVIEREQRPVYGEARTRYREAAVKAWLSSIRETADIEIYIAP